MVAMDTTIPTMNPFFSADETEPSVILSAVVMFVYILLILRYFDTCKCRKCLYLNGVETWQGQICGTMEVYEGVFMIIPNI